MLRLFCFLSILFLLSSCFSNKKISYIQSKKFSKVTPTLIDNKKTQYKIQTNDVLSINVFNIVDKSTPNIFEFEGGGGGGINPAASFYVRGYSVDDKGFIIFPTIGKIKVSGLTVEEARELIQQNVDKYLTNATAIVKLVSFRITILGEVRSPGYHAVYANQATIFEALGMSGDITVNGSRKNIKLVRQTETGSEVIILDLTDPNIIKSPYYYLLPNDVVYVQPSKAQLTRTNLVPLGTLFGAISATFLILNYFNPN